MFGRKSYEARRICIVNPSDAFMLNRHDNKCVCRPGEGRHYTRSKVDGLISAGEMRWVGKHRNVATFVNPMTWQKTYQRTPIGEVISCGLQMVPGGIL